MAMLKTASLSSSFMVKRYILRRTTRNRRSKSLRSIACPRYRSVLDINRYRNASANQRIIRPRSDRTAVHRGPGKAYAMRQKPCGSHETNKAERPSTSVAGLWGKGKPWANAEIAARTIRLCSETRGSKSVLRCRRHTRRRGPRAHAIPWQMRLLR